MSIIQTFPRSTGGSGGTSDYTDLENKPQIAGVTLFGNKTLPELGIQPAEAGKGLSTEDYTTAEKTKLDNIDLSDLLKRDECQPLTQEQMEDIKSQFHPQANGSNVNIVPYHIYDGTERVVGSWFGETLYEKTIIKNWQTDILATNSDYNRTKDNSGGANSSSWITGIENAAHARIVSYLIENINNHLNPITHDQSYPKTWNFQPNDCTNGQGQDIGWYISSDAKYIFMNWKTIDLNSYVNATNFYITVQYTKTS